MDANKSDRTKVVESIGELLKIFSSIDERTWHENKKNMLFDRLGQLHRNVKLLGLKKLLKEIETIQHDLGQVPATITKAQIHQISEIKLRLQYIKLLFNKKETQSQENKSESSGSSPQIKAQQASSIDNKQIAEKYKALRKRYNESLGKRLNSLDNLWIKMLASNDKSPILDELLMRLHKLAGNAGTFGYSEISKKASILNRSLTTIKKDMKRLTDKYIKKTSKDIEELISLQHSSPISPLQKIDQRQMPSNLQRSSDAIHTGQKLIYMFDDDTRLAQFVSIQLEYMGYVTKLFRDSTSITNAIEHKRPSLIIMDISFPEGEYAGIQSINILKNEVDPTIPVIFMSSKEDLDSRIQVVRAMGDAYITKPVDINELLSLTFELIERNNLSNHHIVILHDNVLAAQRYKKRLEEIGFKAEILKNPDSLTEELHKESPDVLLVSPIVGKYRGYQLAKVIQQQHSFQGLPIFIIDSNEHVRTLLPASHVLGVGSIPDIVSDNQLRVILTDAIKERQLIKQYMLQANTIDVLTGLSTRNHFLLLMELLHSTFRVEPRNYLLIIINLQNHKQLINHFEKSKIDELIIKFAAHLRKKNQASELTAYLDNAEFAILKQHDDAPSPLEFIGSLINSFELIGRKLLGKTIPLAITSGYAAFNFDNSPESALRNARYSTQNIQKDAPRAISNSASISATIGPSGSGSYDQKEAQSLKRPAPDQMADDVAAKKQPSTPAKKPAQRSTTDKSAIASFTLPADKITIEYQALVSLRGLKGAQYEAVPYLDNKDGSPLALKDFLEHKGHFDTATRISIYNAVFKSIVKQLKHTKNVDNVHLLIPFSVDILSDLDALSWLERLIQSKNLQHNQYTFIVSDFDPDKDKNIIEPLLNVFDDKLFSLCIDNLSSIVALKGIPENPLIKYYRLSNKTTGRRFSPDTSTIDQLVKEIHKHNAYVINSHIDRPELLTLSWSADIDYVQGSFIHVPDNQMNFEFVKF